MIYSTFARLCCYFGEISIDQGLQRNARNENVLYIVQKHKQKNKGFISDEIEICNRETGVQSGRGSKSGLDGMMLSQI